MSATDSGIQARAAAARELIAAGELDAPVALSYVVWPSAKLADIPSRVTEYPPELRDRALELVDGGASWAQAARAVGVHKQTVGGWVKAQRRVAA